MQAALTRHALVQLAQGGDQTLQRRLQRRRACKAALAVRHPLAL